MTTRIPAWIKKVGLILIGFSALALVLGRTVDSKKWIRSQLAVPRGPGGWLFALTMPMFHKVLYSPAAEFLQLRPDDDLVEVACGSGVFLKEHAAHVKRIAGLDMSDIQVGLARRRLRHQISAGTAEIVRGDAVALPWEDNRFTAATCLGTLEFLSDPVAALREMKRVLQPGGRIVVTCGIDENDEDCVKETEWWGFPHPSEAESRKMVEDAGFSLVSITYLDDDYPARFIQGVKPE